MFSQIIIDMVSFERFPKDLCELAWFDLKDQRNQLHVVNFELGPQGYLQPTLIWFLHQFGSQVNGCMVPQELFGDFSLLHLYLRILFLILYDLLGYLFYDGSGPPSMEVGLEKFSVTELYKCNSILEE